ncbi:MAG: malate dehydrogenase [Gammaproteobacteria bacterium]|nr:MAG: malate dehydrogenase [Gammaproteobacteria bacterium]
MALDLSDKNKLKEDALLYHSQKPYGKTSTTITKPCDSQLDLSLAYTPGVAEPVRAIADNPATANLYTNKANLVAVITDGTAILGLGNLGALASKPVMEGKAVLFKKFGHIDVFDIEINSANTEDFIKTVKNISPTFGGINLEDIAAPACFEIEKRLIDELDIPVFHDDQHGTAIITVAGLLNALEIQNKKIEDVKIVCIGAGAAAISTMNLIMEFGAKLENIRMIDRTGVIREGRTGLDQYKSKFIIKTDDATLKDAMVGSDVMIGLSAPDIVDKQMIKSMNSEPVIFALSNPDPEIHPKKILQARDDAIIGTGRSDFPNQVNNVLGFPFIFRGALDAKAKCINIQMKKAAVLGLQKLTKQPVPQEVIDAYDGEKIEFSKNYIIPKPVDPRLLEYVAEAVKQAAIDSGVANI